MVAIALAVVIVTNVASFALLLVVGEPFGSINDAGIAIAGLLTALLALLMYRITQMSSALDVAALGAALVGGVVTALGSALVLSGAANYYYAGLVMGLGSGFLGLWLAVVSRSRGYRMRFAPALSAMGTIIGSLMATGLIAGLGLAMGIEDIDAAPAWLGFAFVGTIAQAFLLPLWSVRLARSLLTG